MDELDDLTREWSGLEETDMGNELGFEYLYLQAMNQIRILEKEQQELKEIDRKNCEFILQLIEENNQLRYEKKQLEEQLKQRGHWEL